MFNVQRSTIGYHSNSCASIGSIMRNRTRILRNKPIICKSIAHCYVRTLVSSVCLLRIKQYS